MRFLVISATLICLAYGFLLDGSTNSFSQFRKWGGGTNGSLEFEFKTDQPNGLLLYTDDGGTYDFFEIKLVEGALRLRYNLGGGAQIITVGRDLNDGHWHKVHVQRHEDRTILTVDGVSQMRTSRGKEFNFGRFSTNSDVFVGGMPTWYNTKLTLLALPSVIFEPRFVGAVRNLIYPDTEGGTPRRQETRPKDHRILRGNSSDACEVRDPCQHGGICISTDSGPICECRNPDYEGEYCEKDKAPSEAVFRGTEFLSYDLSQTGGEPIVSAQDSVTFYFKTRQPNGLLFYTGEGSDYLNVAIKEGWLCLTMGLANGKQEMQIKPNKVRFDDNQWHKVSVHRRIQEISAITSFCRLSAVVDGVYADHSHIAGKFTMLSSSRVYVGGSINTRALPGARVHNNFVGCMRKVEFVADTLRLNLLELGRSGSHLIQVAGRLDYKCPTGETHDPITFTTRESHLILPPWNAKKSGNISFKFRTNEANGLILFNGGIRPPRVDLFAVEIYNGHIYIHLDLGSGPSKQRGSRRRIDDGNWHEVTFRRTGRDSRITVDGFHTDFRTTEGSTSLELDGNMYVGGLGPPFSEIPIPAGLWTAVLQQGFVGCFKDLVMNNEAVDVASYAREQDSGSIRTLCHTQPQQCPSQPCLNGGLCTEGWNRFVCDCTNTPFSGPTCGKEAPMLSFNGTQHMEVTMDSEMLTQTEDIVLRFRTTKPLGLLLITSTAETGDRIELAVAAGRIRLALRLSVREKKKEDKEKDKILLAGQNVNDNDFHTVRLSRRGSNLKLQLDNQSPIRAEIQGKYNTLQWRTIHLGGLYHLEEEISMSTTVPNFIGDIQQFYFNNIPYIELARALSTEQSISGFPSIKVAAKFVKHATDNLHRPVTFRSKHTFIGLPMLRAYSSIHIDFMFKTREANGLIMFNGGKKEDFVAVELVDGHINYVVNVGDGTVTLRDTVQAHLNDNRWHTVGIRRPSAKQHTLMVDDDIVIAANFGTGNLELDGILYLGGVYKDLYAQLPQEDVKSRHGFEGCIAGLDLNGESPNIMEDAVVHSSLVIAGCEAEIQGKYNTLQWRTIHLGGLYHLEEEISMSTTVPNFIGDIQQFYFNNIPYIELARALSTEQSISGFPSIKVAAKFVKHATDNLHRPVTFRSKHTFIGLPMLRAYSSIHIDFMFKTREANGLIMFNGGKKEDFVAVELVDGHINYVVNVGDGTVTLRDTVQAHLNDNRWHTVGIRRPSAKQHTLMVDDDIVIAANFGTGNLELDGILYLGGVYKDLYAQLPQEDVKSRHGFEGCIAGLDLNGESPNIMEDAVVHSSLVIAGCEGQSAKCSHNVCANAGICVQQWNSYTCDCDMTTYTGPTCSDESVSYEFGPNRGIITYTFPEDNRPEMQEDTIAIGFITTKSDAVLLRIVSGTSNDYIEMYILEGNVFVVYNLGTNDHPLGEISVKVNDNAYHVVKFHRQGHNSSLQVDDYNVRYNYPTGHQLQVFNSQSQIQIGGKWSKKGRIERPFSGIISGVVVNGLRILDLAAEKDVHASIRGDVQLISGILDRQDHLQKMQQTPASGFPGVEDDLVFSGAGSGCNGDDEDECPPLPESGSGDDDLITPVYIPPTRPPPTAKTPKKNNVEKDCDDEDCGPEGSGSGEVTEESTKPTDVTENTIPSENVSTKSTEDTSTVPAHSTTISTSLNTSTSSSIEDGITTVTHSTKSDTTTPYIVIEDTTITTTERHTDPPVVHRVPPPPSPIDYNLPTNDYKPRPRPPERVSSETSEIIALIIGIIAGALIAVILIILVILKFKSRGDRSFKVDDSKGFQQGPNAALLGNTSTTNGQTQYQLNGALRNGGKTDMQKSKKRDNKDIKEWYV